MKYLIVYDIEVLKNVFLCCCYNTKTKRIERFEISERRNDLEKLVAFFNEKDSVFVGYNNLHYDGPIVYALISNFKTLKHASYIEITKMCFDMSSKIINSDKFPFWHLVDKISFIQIDLMTMMASKALRVGLKSLQVTMCYKNVKEMGVDWESDFPIERIDELIYYCDNDVSSTSELTRLLKKDIQLRLQIQKQYQISCLSKDGVGIGVDIFTKFVCEKLNCDAKHLETLVDVPDIIVVKDYIQPCIEFKTKPFKDLLKWYQNMTITINEHDEEVRKEQRAKDNKRIRTWEELVLQEEKTKFKRNVLCGNLLHTFALGGVHSVNKPEIFQEDKDYIIRDEDVESYYPSLALIYSFGPDGFRQAFLEVMQFLKDGRVVAKLIAKDKTKTDQERSEANLINEVYKLALNSILGNLKNKYSVYYAPHMNVAICVNGQLMLAMLIEECELKGIRCIASNTDGATFKIHRNDIALFEDIRNKWVEKTQMKLETALYEKMVIYAVNDYVAFKKGYSEVKHEFSHLNPYDSIRDKSNPMMNKYRDYVKEKGLFITEPRLGKGLDSLINAKALINYYGLGKPIEETINEATSIWDFIKFQKVGRQYDVFWNNEKQQHINRFYVSKNSPYLHKVKTEEKPNKRTGVMETTTSTQNVLKGFGVELFNEFEEKPFEDYKIYYGYYINQVNKVKNQLNSNQTSLF